MSFYIRKTFICLVLISCSLCRPGLFDSSMIDFTAAVKMQFSPHAKRISQPCLGIVRKMSYRQIWDALETLFATGTSICSWNAHLALSCNIWQPIIINQNVCVSFGLCFELMSYLQVTLVFNLHMHYIEVKHFYFLFEKTWRVNILARECRVEVLINI